MLGDIDSQKHDGCKRELGLEPGGALGHGYLVPYKTNQAKRGEKPIWVTECQFIAGIAVWPNWRVTAERSRSSKRTRSILVISLSSGAEPSRNLCMNQTISVAENALKERPATTPWHATRAALCSLR